MQGVLLVDKPKGWTSFDVVNYVRKLLAQALSVKPKTLKVGHTGTLDPLASGLLIVLIGSHYTRRAQELSHLDKTYDVYARLGQTSSTGDEEGEKQLISDRVPSTNEISAVLQNFSGELQQTPPIYSAIKVQGQRAYQLARAGQSVSLEPRTVKIYQNKLISYQYPLVHFQSTVSSGTYIRSLVEDIGRQLQTGAYLADLCRTNIGQFTLKNAVTVQNIHPEQLASQLVTLD
jgi:tRNA pseudouridine55 synthase